MYRHRTAPVAPGRLREEELPDDLTGICVQQKNLRTWIQKALAFYSRGNFDNFVLLLEKAIAGCLRTYSSYKDDLAKANVLLAAHFTRQAYNELGSRQTALQAKVTNILRLLDGMKRPEDRHLLVIRGYALMLTPGRAQESDSQFVAVLRHVPSHIPALIGRGCLAYNRQDYIGALGYFKSVLMHQPRGPADVRVGIAHCFLKLGNLDSARRSFELALEHNGRCHNALLGMAILKLNQCEKAPTREGINLLCAAYELNNRHPVVLNILSSHYYYVRDYKNTPTLAGNSYMYTDIPLLQSQNCFQIARSFHALKQFDQATDFYLLAVRLAPEGYVLPQFGLAQMHLRRGEPGKAMGCLETLLKVMPNKIEAVRLLGRIYLEEKKTDEGIRLLLKVVASRCSSSLRDYDSWLALARAYEQKQLWTEAIDAYRKAMRICLKQAQSYPIEWLNNVAVIQKLAKMPQPALDTIDQALTLNGTKDDVNKETNMLTLRFNRGRILEDLHRRDLAAIAYKDILDEYPQYCDCYLRLGVMALRQNDVNPATEYFKDVLKYDNDSLAARTCMSNIYISMGLTTKAMYCLNVILKGKEKLDANTLVSVGNVCLKNIHQFRASRDDSSAKRHQQKALLFFARALERNPRNMWAANGIGAALSSRNRKTAGEAVFKQIVEAGKECPSAILNSAHMALELGKHQEAIEAYKQCLQPNSLHHNSVGVMLGLSKALYLGGNAIESKLWLSRARHLDPRDPVLMYNLGLAIQEESEQVLGRTRAKSEDLIKAEQELQAAFGYFDYLSTCLSQCEVPLDAAAIQAKKCESLLAKFPVELQRVRQLETQDEERIRMQEAQQREEQEQLAQERLQQEQAMAYRQAVLDRTKKLLKEPNEPTHKKPSKGEKGHRTKKSREDKDRDEKREAKKRKRSAEKDKKSAKKRKAKDDASKKKSSSKYKSKEFIEDSENSGSEASEEDFPTSKRFKTTEESRSKKKTNKETNKPIYTSSDSGSEAMEEVQEGSPRMVEPETVNPESGNWTHEMTIQYIQDLQRKMEASTGS